MSDRREKITKMREESQRVLDHAPHSFGLNEAEIASRNEWIKTHVASCEKVRVTKGAIQTSNFSYIFRVNGIGNVAIIVCVCGEQKDITDYDSW